MQDLCLEAFNKIINLEHCLPFEITNAKLYYEKYATEKEKIAFERAFVEYRKIHRPEFEDRYRNAFEIFIKHGWDNKKFEEYGDEIGISFIAVKRYPATYVSKYATEEEKASYQAKIDELAAIAEKKEAEANKYLWEYCQNIKWDFKKIAILASEQGVTSQTIRKNAISYAKKYLGKSEAEIIKSIKAVTQQEKNVDRNASKYDPIFQKLTLLNNEQEIIDYLVAENPSPYYLSIKIPSYVASAEADASPEIQKELEEQLTAKVAIYSDYVNSKRSVATKARAVAEAKKTLPEAIAIVEKLIAEDYTTKEQFCWDNGITIDVFEKYLKKIEKYDPQLFKIYNDKIANQRLKKQAAVLGKLNKIVEGIKSGIVIDEETTRPYDLIDYYLATKMSLEDFFAICSERLSAADLKIVKRFFDKYRYQYFLGDADIRMILADWDEVNTKKDEKGIPIYGSGRLITSEEKLAVIDYLNRHKICVTDRTYAIAFRRSILGLLDINKEPELNSDTEENKKQK